MFFKKKKSPEQYPLPDEIMPEILELFDQMHDGNRYRAKHAIWKKVEKALPGVNLREGRWEINTQNSLTFYVRRIK